MGKKSALEKIEKKTDVKGKDLMKLASKYKGANFKDEKTVKKIISQVAKLANVSVSKKTEEKLVKAITQNKIPKDMSSIEKLSKKL